MLTNLVIGIHLVMSGLLIGLVLLHSGKGGGLSDMFGGSVGSHGARLGGGGAQPRPHHRGGRAHLRLHHHRPRLPARLTRCEPLCAVHRAVVLLAVAGGSRLRVGATARPSDDHDPSRRSRRRGRARCASGWAVPARADPATANLGSPSTSWCWTCSTTASTAWTTTVALPGPGAPSGPPMPTQTTWTFRLDPKATFTERSHRSPRAT